MKKNFIFLLALVLMALMPCVGWGQTGSGTQQDPWIIDLNNPQDIGNDEGGDWRDGFRYQTDIVDWHGNNEVWGLFTGWTANHDNYIEIKRIGYYKMIGNQSKTTDRIWIRATGNVYMTMENVNIEAQGLGHKGGRPFALESGVNLALTLAPNSVNRLNSVEDGEGQNAAAIFLPQRSHLTVTKESEQGALYATGFVGIGAAQDDGVYGTCGQLDLNGGTVVIRGSEYGVGGIADGGHQPFTVNGNTFLIIEGPLTSSQEYHPDKGIIYLDGMQGGAATVYGEVTLSSEYPEAGDGKTYDLRINEGAHLTLGSGVKMPVARLVSGSEARLYAYKVNWDPNEVGTDHVGNAPEPYYYGGNIEVTNGFFYTCGGNKHEQVGWLLDGETAARVSYTTENVNPNSLIKHTLGAVWIDKTRKIDGNIEEPLKDNPKLSVYPENVNNVTFTPASALPKGLKYKGGVFSGTAESAGKSQVAFNVSVGDNPVEGKATNVTFDIAQNKDRVIDVTKGEVTGSLVYSGAVSNEIIKDDYIKVFDTNGSQLTHIYYDYTCDFTPAAGTALKAAKSVNTIKDAGTYSNFVITPKADMNVSLSDEGASFTLKGTITVTPQTLTVTPNNPGSINEGEALPESYTYRNTGAIKGETPTFEGKLSIKNEDGSEVADSNTPGKYEVYQGSLKLVNGDNFTATNYQLQVKSGFYLTIIDDISDDNITITLNKNSWEYDGQIVTPEDIVKVEGLPDGSYTITVKRNGNASRLQNAGEYTVVLTGKDAEHTGSKEFETPKITITPKSITGIKASDQEIELGGTVKTDVAQNPEIVTVEGLVRNEKAVFTSGTIQVDANTNVAGVYTDALSIQNLEIAESGTGFWKNNYSGWESFTSSYGKGTLTVKDDSGIDIEIPEDGEIEVDENGNVSFPYDGKNHNNFFADKKITVKYTEGEEEKTLELGTSDYKVTWQKDNSEWTSTDEPWNVGAYVATITITKTEPTVINGKSTVKTLTVKKRALTAEIKDKTIDTPASSTDFNAEGNVTVSNTAEGETAVLAGKLKVNASGLQEGRIYKGVIVKGDGFALTDGVSDNKFKASNYELKDESITAGDLTVKRSIDPTDPVDPTDPENPIIIPGGDGEWTWDAEKDAFVRTYDGYEHAITNLKVKFTDSNNEVRYQNVAVTATYQPAVTPKDYVEGGYTATVTIPENDYIEEGDITIKLMILRKDLSVDFNIPNPLTEEEASAWNADYITIDGYVKSEKPMISEDCHLEIKDSKVILKGFALNNNVTNGFKKNNYDVTYYNNGSEIDITEGGEIEIPGIDIPGDGGSITTYHDLHILESVGAKLTSRHDKDRTPDGGSFTLSLEKEPGYEDCEPTVYYKRGRFGEWKEVKLDEVSGYYQIRNVYTDIYVKVSGDGIWPVSNEQIEAQEVQVYSRDGKIVVVTPTLMDVQVVSMTGALVAVEKVAGQREFENLAAGVYIVRAGETVVKVQL